MEDESPSGREAMARMNKSSLEREQEEIKLNYSEEKKLIKRSFLPRAKQTFSLIDATAKAPLLYA